ARLPWGRCSGEAALRLGVAAAGAAGFRRAGVRGGRAAGPERRRSPGGRRSRPLLEGEARPRLLPARSARAAFSALSERAFPPRRAPALDRTTPKGGPGAETRLRRRQDHAARQNVTPVSRTAGGEIAGLVSTRHAV